MPAPSLVVATFNLHAGIDGWGRPFDVQHAVRTLDADVVVLQEVWKPGGEITPLRPTSSASEPSIPAVSASAASGGAAAGSPANGGQASTAASIASALGYEVTELGLATGRRAGPHPRADHRWMRAFDWRGNSHAIYLDSARALPPAVARSPRFLGAEPGSWGIAVLTRLPVVSTEVIDLGLPRRDRTQRAAIVVRVDVAGRTVSVAGTHMTHLTYGSPASFARLNRELSALAGDGPAVLAGDMNLWGPPASFFLHGWRRAVRGRTWPAWRPHSQIDHIFVRGPLAVMHGTVVPPTGSDHRAITAQLRIT